MRPVSLVVLACLSSSVAFAHPPGSDGYDGHGRPAHLTPPTTPPAGMVIPDTYPGVVTSLREQAAAAETALTNARIIDLHRSSANMTQLTAALPVRAETLPAEAKAKVATTATHLGEQLTLFVSTADKGDTAGAKAAMVAIKADLDVLAGLVPPPAK